MVAQPIILSLVKLKLVSLTSRAARIQKKRRIRLNSDSLPTPLLFMKIISQAGIVLDSSIPALQFFFFFDHCLFLYTCNPKDCYSTAEMKLAIWVAHIHLKGMLFCWVLFVAWGRCGSNMAAELLFSPKSYIEHLLLSTAPGFRGQSARARDMAQWVEVLFGMYRQGCGFNS